MDLAEVKDLIKSLLVAANGCCSIQELLIDFEEETGFELPHFNFYNPRDFLLTLTDITKVFNSESGEWIRLVEPIPPRDLRMYARRCSRTQIRENERPNLSLRSIDFEGGIQHHDINLFIRAYQMGWVTLNEKGDWEKVNSRCGLEQDDTDAENIEFLFSNEEKDDPEDIRERRASIRRFLARIDFVKDPTNYPPYARPINYPLPYTCASAEIQNNLKDLMMFQSEPFSWRQLPDLYFQFYRSHFSPEDHGYRTLLEMVKSLKEIFRCVRLAKDDWLLFDASKAPEPDEEKVYIWAFRKLPKDIITCIVNLLETHCEQTSQPGIPRDNFLALYYKKYRKKLDFTLYGFPDFKSLLSKLNGKILRVEYFGRDVIIKPLVERSKLRKRTIFNLNPGDDAFTELFPIECIGFGTKYREMKPEYFFRLGRLTNVNMAEVYSPHKFYVRLKKYEKDFADLMERMQYFYEFHENKCRMPAATIRPNQICVALFTDEGQSKWYRAIIKKVPDEKNVIVFLVDLGAELKLDNECIRFLHRKFYSLPKQGFFARIYNIKSLVEGKWPSSICSDFMEILFRSDVKFRLMRYDQKAEILLGVLYIAEYDGLESVGKMLVDQYKADMKFDDNEPYDGEENAEPCLELVPVIRQTVEGSGSHDLQPSDLEPQDDYFDIPDEFYDSSGMSSPELLEIIFDRIAHEEPHRRSHPAHLYDQFCKLFRNAVICLFYVYTFFFTESD